MADAPPRPSPAVTYDLAIIGGGVNGTAIARDAAGRGWKVALVEQGDLASATSSASTKLIHGGLRYLEYYEFHLVREALTEREVLWGIAPHIIQPLRFVLPYERGMRPAWLLRLGLFLYDHLGGRRRLPPTRTLRLDRDEAGAPLKPGFRLGYEYSDCRVDDARLVVLNALDAAGHGADIATRTRCTAAHRVADRWELALAPSGGPARTITARALVNAAGPWVADVLGRVIHVASRARVRMVQGSHIVVPRLYRHDRCYIFQNRDRRIFFAIPYERDYTLIGTTDQDYHGDPAAVAITEAEIAYLCAGASEYFREPITPDMVVWSYSGVRPLYDDGASTAQAATREYVLTLDTDGPACLSVFGGKITTSRRLALAALERLAPHLPQAAAQPAGWTASAPLPGGDFAREGLAALVDGLRRDYPFLPEPMAVRLAHAYGTRARRILGEARSLDELEPVAGSDLTAAELRYLVAHEWAMTADDVLWRRSKLGLRFTKAQAAAVAEWLAREGGDGR